jgi:hypothetical protein
MWVESAALYAGNRAKSKICGRPGYQSSARLPEHQAVVNHDFMLA